MLIAAYNNVMSAVCHSFEIKKQEKTRTLLPTSRNKKSNSTAKRNEWECYFSVATHAA